MIEQLSSLQNSIVKDVAKLAEKKHRLFTGLFIVEGHKLLKELYDSDWHIEKILISKTAREGISDSFIQQLSSRASVYLVTEEIISKITDAQTAQGVVAVVKMRDYKLCDLPSKLDKILCLDDVRDPGNVGTLIRTAVATGADAVVLLGNCVDIYSPKVVRACMGAMLRVPIVSLTIEQLTDVFETRKINSFAAILDKNAQDLFSYSFTKPVAVVLGNESHGISKEVLNICTNKVFIPQIGNIESLNVAVAGSVILYEILRQTGRNIE
mgnify:CR=1 FL=1